jgi:hypothetical protein
MCIPGVVGTLAKPVDLATLEARVLEALSLEAAEPEVMEPEVMEPVVELAPQPRSEPVAPVSQEREAPSMLVPTPPPASRPALGEPDEDGWVEIQPSLPERES